MISLDIKVDANRVKQSARPVLIRRAEKNQVAASPVNTVELSYYEEQELYDRMYEAQVYHRGKFFGYRSTAGTNWHDSESAREAAAAPSSQSRIRKIAEVLSGQGDRIDLMTDGELKKQHRYCLSGKLYKDTYGEDK